MKLNIIPYPNSVRYLHGRVKPDALSGCRFELCKGMDESAYTLVIKPDGVTARASGEKGLFYAKQTVNQLLLQNEIPCCVIEDRPAFEYRGFMVDCVRHIVSIEETKRLIDAAASVKMNVMHWHLSDDQGFRLQIEKRPELAEKSAYRKASLFGDENDRTPYGTSFTKDEIREVIDYAAQRFIEVIPEIDMPGHTCAILHAYPELSCRKVPIDVQMKQGIFPDILCAGNEAVFELVFDILSEVCELFPSEYIHIGGDEAPKGRWKECPECQRKIKELNLKDEEELQGWFVNRIVDYLKSKGRKAIVWNESLKSGKVKGVTVQRWMEKNTLSAAYANGGGRVIMSDFYHYYADYPYAMTPLKKTYNYSPYIKGLNAQGRANVAGVETPLWTEYVKDFDRLCFMWFPRFTAVAETGWTLEKYKDEADFERRFECYRPILESFSIKSADKAEWNPWVGKRLKNTVSFFMPAIKSFFKKD